MNNGKQHVADIDFYNMCLREKSHYRGKSLCNPAIP